MRAQWFSVKQWKIVFGGLIAICLGVQITAALRSDIYLDPQLRGSLRFDQGKRDDTMRYPIEKLEPDSPLIKAGAKVGDTIAFDQLDDTWRLLSTRESVGLTVFPADGHQFHIDVTPVPDPEIPSASVRWIQFASRWVTILITMAMACLIGFRRAEATAMRALALALLTIATQKSLAFLPGGWLVGWGVPAIAVMLYSGYFFLIAYFALTFSGDRPYFGKVWVRRSFVGFARFFFVMVSYKALHEFAVVTWDWHNVLTGSHWDWFFPASFVLIFLCGLGYSWKTSAGEERRRVTWIASCLGVYYGAPFLLGGLQALGVPDDLLRIALGLVPLSFCVLAYALLRHRLFDIGFAVNRALVVTIISSLLLVVFAITEWAVDKLLHFEGREKNVIFDALVALGIILTFHRIQHWVNHKVDHIFFHQWHEAAKRLRHFMKAAVHITDASALQSKFIAAITEFAGAQGGAIYLAQPDGRLVRTQSTLAAAPATIGANDDAVIELRHRHEALHVTDVRSSLAGELAFPMLVRGRLSGLVTIGAKHSGQGYRPDEVVLLTSSAHKLGMDLESLRVEELEQLAATSTRSIALLEQTIQGHVREADALKGHLRDLRRQLGPAELAAPSQGT